MRDAFVSALVELAACDPRIMLLTADLGFDVLDPFAARFPKQYLNVGVAEQNMTGVATGMAMVGTWCSPIRLPTFPRCAAWSRSATMFATTRPMSRW